MREILFRGKRKDDGEWVEGYLLIETLYYTKKEYFIVPKDFDFSCGEIQDYYVVIPETIGQYTGLKDKNGKMIFEGDVVFLKDRTDKYIVVYNEMSCAFELKGVFSDTQTNFYRDIVESVIGNRWDNPELLKEGIKQ